MTEKPDVDELEFTDEELVEVLKNHGVNRRNVLRAVGVGGAATLLGTGSAAAATGSGQSDIDPHFGKAVSEGDPIPHGLRSPDHTVEVHTREDRVIRKDGHPTGVRFGAFHFHKAGLHVKPGDIVKWEFMPEHMVASYTTRMGRQRRVPNDTPSFASPVMSEGDSWFYRFEKEGVYDMFCPPHEQYGMAMRIVVGDDTSENFGPADPANHERPPDGLASTLLNLDELDPGKIKSAGSVTTDSLYDVPVTIPSRVHNVPLGEVAVPLESPVPESEVPGFN